MGYFSSNSLHPTKNRSTSCAALVDSRFPVQKCFLTEEADFQRLCAEADELLDSASSGKVAMAEKRLVGADQVAVLWVAVGLMAEVGSPNKGV